MTMNFCDYRQHDGLGLAQLVAEGQVSASELLELAIACTEAIDPAINAVVVRMDALVRTRCRNVSMGPFAGVPFLLKNLEQDHAGVMSVGHEVEMAAPTIDWEQMFADVMTMMYANAAFVVTQVHAATGCGKDGFEPDTLLMAAFGRAIRADEYVASLARWQDYQRITNQFLSSYDAFITPTVAFLAPLTGENTTPRHEQVVVGWLQAMGMSRVLLGSKKLKEKVHGALRHIPFTELANLTGTPAMSVPLHWTPDGMPLGVHFMAGPSQ